MENYINILKQIRKETAAIKKETAELDRLDFEAEKTAAIEEKDFARYKELKKAAENNAGAYSKLCNKIYLREIKKRVLSSNLRAAVFDAGYRVIAEAFKPYEGKQYGEKTREKIEKEVRAAGFGFYFHGYNGKYQIVIYTLDNGYKTGSSIEAEGWAVVYTDERYPDGKSDYFITDDNTINLGNVYAKPHDTYFEDPTAATKAIYKAIKDHQAALEKARATEEALRAIIPDGIARPDHLSEYRPTF